LEICAKFFEPCAAAQLTRQPPERGRRLSFSETRRTRADTPARRLIVAGAFVQGADQYKNVDNAQQFASFKGGQRIIAAHRPVRARRLTPVRKCGPATIKLYFVQQLSTLFFHEQSTTYRSFYLDA
jgi:hypothetical protein